MKQYKCERCGFTTEEEGEASQHAFEEHDAEPEEVFTENTSDIIEESPEEDPDEDSAIDEETLELIADQENLTETERGVLLLTALGSKKEMLGKARPSELDRAYLLRIGEKLRKHKCPFCDLTAEKLNWRAKLDERAEKTSEELGRNIQYAEKEVPMIINHVKTEHMKIYETLKDVFNQYIEANEQECLSKEQLSRRIAADSELRRKLFHKWKELEETENRNQ